MSQDTTQPSLVVFSDLDGTLLDHDTYSFDAARPAIDALKRAQIPLVLASSKTAAEIARLHGAMALGASPAIVENGAGTYDPAGPVGAADDQYRNIRDALTRVPDDLRRHYRGFGDMTDAEVAEITGLPAEEAKLARTRCFSEPGLWSGDDAGREAFLAALAAGGISARQGGRFLTLSFGRTKADAMVEVARDLGATVTMALGDAPNDAEMIETATYGVIIRNDHGPDLPPFAGEDTGRIIRTSEEGPTGWNAAVLELLKTLGLAEGE